MCGRFNLAKSPEVDNLCQSLGIDSDGLRYSGDIAPGAKISIIYQIKSDILTSDAIWSLLLDTETLKPHRKYATFNTRSDKLHQPRSIGYKPFCTSRCIIPASAFIEGLGDRKTYHKIEFEKEAVAFGGLYKEWVSKETGEIIRSASIITLPSLPQWEKIHPKSYPLMLPGSEEVRRQWLNPCFQDVAEFEELLKPGIETPQIVTPIGKVSLWNGIGDPFIIR